MGWIAVDLDKTLAYYESGQWPEIGEPIQPMLDRVKRWREQGIEVRIFTARASDDSQIYLIREWLIKHGIGDLAITNKKDLEMDEIWDDKAVQIIPNTGQPILDEKYQDRTVVHIPVPEEGITFEEFRTLEKMFKE